MKHYPKWLYCQGADPILVMDEAEHKELKGKWLESPADVIEEVASEVEFEEAETEESAVKRRGRPPRKIED